MDQQPEQDDVFDPFVARLALDALAEGVAVQRSDGSIVAVNPSAPAILGLTRDQMVGRSSIDPAWRCVHEDGTDWPGETHPAMYTLATGEAVERAFMGVHKPDGSLAWIRITTQPMKLPDGDRGVVVCFTDVTELHDTRGELERQQAFQHSVYQGVGVEIWVLDPEFRIVDCNQTALTNTGYTIGELRGELMTGLFARPTERVQADQLLRSVQLGGPPLRARAHGRARSGSVAILDYTLTAVGVDRLDHVVLTITNITPQVETERARRDAEERLKVIFEASRAGLVVADGEGRIIHCNPAACEMFGAPRSDLVGRGLVGLIHRDDRPRAMSLSGQLTSGAPIEVEFRLRHRNGTHRWAMCVATAMQDPINAEDTYLLQLVDIHDRIEAEQSSRAASARFSATFNNAPVGTAIIDIDQDPGRIVESNWALSDLTGLGSFDLGFCFLGDLVQPDYSGDVALVVRQLAAGEVASGEVEVRLTGPDGIELIVALSMTAIIDDDGAARSAVAQFEDITAIRARESMLTWQNTHDTLTGLANRAAMHERLVAALKVPNHSVAVLFCDLDGFKAVNDQHGHAAGDAVLIEVARRLEHSVRPGDLVARLGGDEFIIVLERLGADSDIDVIANRVLDTVRAPIVLDGAIASVGVSIGVARPDTSDLDDLLRRADEAMYEAKRAGKDRVHHG